MHGIVAGWVGRVVVGAVAVFTSLRYGTGVYFWREAEKLERPTYAVIENLADGVELRRYDSYLIAETEVDGCGFRGPAGIGFRACAGYIFGKNRRRRGIKESLKMAMTAPVRVTGENIAGEKMAMTAPVRVDGGSSRKTKVSFVMGKEYTLRTAPIPTNKDVKLRVVPEHTLAVKSFSGPPPTSERVQKERNSLEKALAAANIKPKNSETLVYGYHDPFITPNILRRNEVAVLIEGQV